MADQKNLRVIVGLGQTGFSCARYLIAQGYSVVVTDNRSIPPALHQLRANFPQIPVYLDSYPEDILSQAKELIVSPGVALTEPAIAKQIARGVSVIGDIELFVRCVKAPVVAITGSNGKSTVTSLVGEMVRYAGKNVRVGGNLGTPALDLLQKQEPDLYVLELSSFQLETTYSLQAATAVVLNVSPDHMDRYANFEAYVKAKQRIYHDCKVPIINRDEVSSTEGIRFSIEPISYGLTKPGANQFGIYEDNGEVYLAYGNERLLAASKLKIKGRHQMSNALAALALGHAVGLPFPAMIEALQQFPGLPHRCQWVAKHHDVDWYNDSKATNVGATCAAIAGLSHDVKGKLILIAGGLGKNADFSSLREPIAQHVRSVILMGKDARLIEQVLRGVVNVVHADGMEQAVLLASQEAQPEDAVLLAPACASFDMFEGFAKRGEAFMMAVRSLVSDETA